MRKTPVIAMAMTVMSLVSCSETQSQQQGQQGQQSQNNRGSQSQRVSTSLEEVQASLVLATETGPRASEDFFSDRDTRTSIDSDTPTMISLGDGQIQVEGSGVEVTSTQIIISQEGSYVLSGTWSNGQILVDLPNETDKVQLVLDDVQLHCDNSAGIHVAAGDKVFITTMDNTINEISANIATGEEADGGIFSRCDLTFNGGGVLELNVSNGAGIVAKDELTITSGTYHITADGHGLDANDGIAIADGSFTMTVGKDGLHAEHSTNQEKGHIYIANGDFHIDCQQDALDAGYFLEIVDGNFDILTNGGWSNAPVKVATSNNGGRGGQTTVVEEEDDGIPSRKGLKAVADMQIYGGNFLLDCYDDAIHGDTTVDIYGGDFHIFSADDGIHANWDLRISDGTFLMERSFESIEGQRIHISGGSFDLYSIDDGFNAASQTVDPSNGDVYLMISGGDIVLDSNSEGDGFDSNGNILISGGNILISSTENERDTTLDSDGASYITGGTFIGSGSNSRTVQNFSTGSTQGSIVVSLSSIQTGSVSLTDSKGTVLAEYSPVKPYQSVIISTPDLTVGESYELTAGDYSTSVEMNSLQS